MSYARFYPKQSWLWWKEYEDYENSINNEMLLTKEEWQEYHEYQNEIQQAEIDAENAWLRHAESAGADEKALERRIEDSRGVIQFSDAMKIQR